MSWLAVEDVPVARGRLVILMAAAVTPDAAGRDAATQVAVMVETTLTRAVPMGATVQAELARQEALVRRAVGCEERCRR